MTRLLACALAVVALTATACGGGSSTAASSQSTTSPGTTQGIGPCKASQLTGGFSVVHGSAGAGNIVYALVLRNRSGTTCTLTGLPEAQLLGADGKRLPTHVAAASRGALTAILVRLAPGKTTRATARFSPDVPGKNEQHPGRCEPVAHSLRVVAPGGGGATVPIAPPTPVCEHGYLSFTAYGNAKS